MRASYDAGMLDVSAPTSGHRRRSALALILAACSSSSGGGNTVDGSVVLVDAHLINDAPANGAVDAPVIDAPVVQPDSARTAYCMGQGPPITVGDTGSTTTITCTGTIAANAFRFALCVCQGLASGAPITTDSFDSRGNGQDAGTMNGTGGSVGTNSNINMSALLTVGGDLIVEGTATLMSLIVGHNVSLSDTLSVDNNATITGDANVNGDVKCNGQLQIGGDLKFPQGKSLQAPNAHIAGRTVRQAVVVPPPCDCDAASIYDIASYVQQAQHNNDDADISLDPGMLTNYTGAQDITLPCGRFYLDRIGGQGAITLHISGRTALFVGSDVNLTGPFTVQLSDVGELDLFINGGISSSSPLDFGDMHAPGRVRIYMGGSRNVNLSAGSVLYGNLYAPQSALVTAGTLEVYGSIFVNSFNTSAAVNIHQDVSVISEGTCPTEDGGTPQCQRCQDCGGQACVGGYCGLCTSDSDCCAPLLCNNGLCGYQIP
jgi:hypothetical protein